MACYCKKVDSNEEEAVVYETIVLKISDKIATIVLNRPQTLNAINPTMSKELKAVVQDLARDDKTRVVVITGAGRGFCSGGDLKVQSSAVKAIDPLTRTKNIRPMNEFILGLRNLSKPVIASINGAAVGAGFNLALACDIRIASTEAKFGMVFLKTGLHTDTGPTYFLPRLVGTAKACELIFTGDIINAEEAKQIGLVNSVVEPNSLESTVNELAMKIAKGPPIPIGKVKDLIYKGLTMDLSSVLEWETLAQVLCVQTKDHEEGLAAFIENREPSFIGQ